MLQAQYFISFSNPQMSNLRAANKMGRTLGSKGMLKMLMSPLRCSSKVVKSRSLSVSAMWGWSSGLPSVTRLTLAPVP